MRKNDGSLDRRRLLFFYYGLNQLSTHNLIMLFPWYDLHFSIFVTNSYAFFIIHFRAHYALQRLDSRKRNLISIIIITHLCHIVSDFLTKNIFDKTTVFLINAKCIFVHIIECIITIIFDISYFLLKQSEFLDATIGLSTNQLHEKYVLWINFNQ